MKDYRKQAAALRYNQSKDHAPSVSAVGKGLTAENIIQKAKENNVPVVEDSTLVGLLSELNINETVPEELYQAVAEVFAFIYRTDQEMSRKKES
ncbi:EscU/YscU/HrcU family type III secretion system export apparatus switch protein [Virgibacillus sediminis]|uniref:EscU/YscU/HrcU family type III secretion system export apparatus switch protein n=1 Tax=Virgibacillus sediminis TaxID=202260 RepID=A0ABV7AAQ1_9BACI